MTIRVLVADDHALVRAGLRALLGTMAGVEVIAEAGTGIEATRLARDLAPDIALLDISMPEMNGIDAAAQIARECPETRTIMLSMYAEADFVRRALAAGALGYVLKDCGVDELERAIRAVMRGELHIVPDVAKDHGAAAMGGTGASGAPALTPRQREVLKLIAEGHGTRAIAGQLHLSVKTVETHRAQIMERLGIHDVAGLTRYAVRSGLVSLDR